MTKKIVLLLMASMLVLAVGCKEKTNQEDINPNETPTNEQEAPDEETPVEESAGKYKSPSKEDVSTVLKEEGFTEVTENVEENEFMFEHVEGEVKTVIKFTEHKDKSFEIVVDEVKEAHIATEAGFFHSETRTDENGFYYSAPQFEAEDIFKADIVVNGTHITVEGNNELIQKVLKALNLPSEEIPVDMGTSDESPVVGETEETPTDTDTPVDEEVNEDLESENPEESDEN